MRITTIHQYDAPSDSDFVKAVELLGEDLSVRIYTKNREDLKKLINILLAAVNLKEKQEA